MKITFEKNIDNTSKKYPYIGVSDGGNMVLFTSPDTGIALVYGWEKEKLIVTDDWIEEDFTAFYGTITISDNNG